MMVSAAIAVAAAWYRQQGGLLTAAPAAATATTALCSYEHRAHTHTYAAAPYALTHARTLATSARSPLGLLRACAHLRVSLRARHGSPSILSPAAFGFRLAFVRPPLYGHAFI